MRVAVLLICLALAGCLPFGKGKTPEAANAAANPITGGQVSTTALAPPPGAAPAAAPQPVVPATPEPAPPEPATAAPVPAATPAPTSPEGVACVAKGGTWARVGKAGNACVMPTGDSGKSCTRGSQCEGNCLARSGSCAPITPMFGCNEILQDDGQRVTLCID